MLRDYQQSLARQAAAMLDTHGVAYLAMQVRTGKTLTALGVAAMVPGVRSVLFITKKKAIESIKLDYMDKLHDKRFTLEVVNYEGLHKVSGEYDLIVCDEAHGLGQYPKPSERALTVRGMVQRNGCPVLLLSGTPTPESYAQLYHQLWAACAGPWKHHANFYAWFKEYGKPQSRWINQRQVQEYDAVYDARVLSEMQPLMLTFTQEEAGFEAPVIERIQRLPMPEKVEAGIDWLKTKRVLTTREGHVIMADTAVKLMQKHHQLCGGTVITEEGARLIIDTSKAEWVKAQYSAARVAVFYKYQAEREALEQVMGKGCDTAEEFNAAAGPARIFLQIQAGREGVNLSSADVLVMYNIDFAAVSYWQARARMQTFDRKEPALVIWLMFRGGIEWRIYEAVQAKKDYTLKHYTTELL
jgi:archaellin